MLTVHAQIEEELLYPAARDALEADDVDLVDEAAVEHASVKELVAQIETTGSEDELFDAKVTVLGEYVKHHVNEEENELFPKLQKTELDLTALGAKLAARKAELMDADETSAKEKAAARRSGPKGRAKGNAKGKGSAAREPAR